MFNIAIIGSCQSRDMFNSRFIDNYSEYFQVSSYFSMTSIISIMSNPIRYNYKNLIKSGFKDCLMEHWFQELEKNALKTLLSKQPDILLMDFYGDARYGALEYGKRFIINRADKLKDKEIINWNSVGTVYNYEHNSEEFITIWKDAFDRFMQFMNEKLSDTKIIINTIKGTKVVTDKEGNKYLSPNVQDIDVESVNNIWKVMDDYAINKYNLKAIRFDKEYTLDPEYPFAGLGYALVHFHPDYYKDCFNGLLEQVVDINRLDIKDVHINLVKDSSYRYNTRCWTNKAGKFEVVEYDEFRAVRAIDCREKLGKYRPQMWSRPIEIYGDGKVSYTLSFYIKISDLSLLEKDSVVFGIRTFKYMKDVKRSEAIEEYPLTLEGHDIQNEKEYRYVFTFTPKGNYIKLAPFMFQYTPGVEYSRIKLERAAKVSKYSK